MDWLAGLRQTAFARFLPRVFQVKSCVRTQVLKLGGFVENLLHVAVRQEQQLRGSGESDL